MSTSATQRYTVDEYLALERASDEKHEYFDGEIFAMAGGSMQRSLIGANTVRELGNKLQDRPCRVFNSDMRVWCPTGLRTYPDASVVCNQPQLEDSEKDTLLNPIVVVEVLSPSTEAYDRGRKFEIYKSIESLREYVLVAQDRAHVDCFTRQPSGGWLLTSATGLESSIEIPALECSIRLAEIYAQVEFEES